MRKDYNYCYYLVAFIDVLGQKEAFQGIDAIPTRYDAKLQEKLNEAHEQTALFIENFRLGFENIFDTFQEESESTIEVPESRKEKFDDLRRVILRYQRFSDCIQACVPLQLDEYHRYHSNVINGVLAILTACGGMLLFSLAEKKAFRVGIEVGIGTELSNGEVYGPALFKAYSLESKIAQYPRIVIGKELLNYLRNLSEKIQQIPNQDQDKEDIELCKRIADKCLKMIIKDLNDNQILDYLGDEFRKIFDKFPQDDREVSYKEIFKKAFDFVKAEYKKRKELGDSKLASRYSQLYNYFKERSPKDENNSLHS